MTELIAYRYKQRSAAGGATPFTPWRSGRRRAEMMAELREIGGDNLVIVQCCVPRAEVDELNGRENDLWIWKQHDGWRKTNTRNWFVDSCDPTRASCDEDPFAHPMTQEQLDYWHRKLYGVEDITAATELDEMTNDDPPNCLTGRPAEDFPSIDGGDIPNEGFVKNKFVDEEKFSLEGYEG